MAIKLTSWKNLPVRSWVYISAQALVRIASMVVASYCFFRKGKKWVLEYRVRNLIGYSAHPTLVEPTHFDGEKGYISDTGEPYSIYI